MGECNMVFAGLFVPDSAKLGGGFSSRSTFPVERAELGVVALQVGDERERLGWVSIALRRGLHLKHKAFTWGEASIHKDVPICDGRVRIVCAVVPGVSAFMSLSKVGAVVPIEPSFSWQAVKICDAGPIAIICSGSDVSQVELFAIDDVWTAHRFEIRLFFLGL